MAVLLDAPVVGLSALLVFCLLKIAVDLAAHASRGRILAWSLVSGLVAAALLATLSGWMNLTWTILLPPILINAGIFCLFARTLLPGREPLITRFRRLDMSSLTAEACLYTRRLTVFWALYLGACTGASLLAALYADWIAWSWIVNVICPGGAAATFLAEHFYRKRYLGHFGPTSLARTFRTMLRAEAWSNSSIDSSLSS